MKGNGDSVNSFIAPPCLTNTCLLFDRKLPSGENKVLQIIFGKDPKTPKKGLKLLYQGVHTGVGLFDSKSMNEAYAYIRPANGSQINISNNGIMNIDIKGNEYK